MSKLLALIIGIGIGAIFLAPIVPDSTQEQAFLFSKSIISKIFDNIMEFAR